MCIRDSFQVHLDARLLGVEKSAVLPVISRKVAADQAVEVRQRVEIELRRHTLRVVVGRFEHGHVLGQVDANEQAAIKALQRSGFDLRNLSIIGRDYHTDEHVVGYYNVGERMLHWGKLGAFWGGLWGLLFGSAMFFVCLLYTSRCV